MQVNQLRQKFLEFFKSHGHEIVSSSSLVPHDDPTLLFTNAGMNQFKDVFLGLEKRGYVRATSAQKCVRAGGKHNDLDNVGYTARHHTFFEMLGNFSFGDYFKQDAISYAWEFLTSPKWLNLPQDKLYVTVYKTDDEAFDIWHKGIGLPESRIIRIGDKASGGSDNFWQMGDTGPCGPCTEIFYDHGDDIPGGLPGTPNEDGDRYIEIWNCVFMQFNRDETGALNKLPKPSVDTGMGLERVAAVLQGKHDNYEIDLFKNLTDASEEILNQTGKNVRINGIVNDFGHDVTEDHKKSFRVIADHIRSVSFLIADGVIPSNEGRGYVLRRIIRRAVRHGYKHGIRVPFFHRLVAVLVKEMGSAYPELTLNQKMIESTIKVEEEQFFRTIDNGMDILKSSIKKIYESICNNVPRIQSVMDESKAYYEEILRDQYRVYDDFDVFEIFYHHRGQAILGEIDRELKKHPLSGEIVFKLYDTYGFPLDLTQDVCRGLGITVDVNGFDKEMLKQKTMAKSAGKFKMDKKLDYSGCDTDFSGYTKQNVDAKVMALFLDDKSVKELNKGQNGVVVLDKTVFYAEGGGQVGDIGVLQAEGGVKSLFDVTDTQRIRSNTFAHVGTLSHGCLKLGDTITATFDLHKRVQTARNHSVTHLLHKALHEVIGAHATQKGSLVCSDYTRFDFAHDKPVSKAQIEEIERIVNHVIMENYEVKIATMSYDEAIKAGAMALFGEKYTNQVRVIKMGDFSIELCGGTHVSRTGDIGLFTITSELGIANGVRRIEAITGEVALKRVQKNLAILDNLRSELKAQTNDIITPKLAVIMAENKSLIKDKSELLTKLSAYAANDLVDQAETLANGIRLLVVEQNAVDNNVSLELVEKLKDKLASGIVVIGTNSVDKTQLIVGVTKDLTDKYKAGVVVNYLAAQIGGKGGGRPDLAQAGAPVTKDLAKVLNSAKQFIMNS